MVNRRLKGLLKIIALSLCAMLVFNSFACGEVKEIENKKEEKRTMTNHAVYDKVELLDVLWEKPDYLRAEELDREEDEDITAYYIRTFYKGEETYAFAYLGKPEQASLSNKAPAVLLIHGGGGSAYWEWVQMWKNRGYVALALDMEGHIPTKDGVLTSYPNQLYTKSQYPAPNNQNYNDSKLALNETWMYYAVSTSIIGNSFLHSLDYVDTYKIGVCGVSWGGVITSIISSYDDRFAFSIPIYGAVNLEGSFGNIADYYEKNKEALIWDDSNGLKNVNTPMLFICSDYDPNFSPDAVSSCASLCKNASVTVKHDFLHSQYTATNILEPYEFADTIVKDKQQMISFKSQPTGKSGSVELNISGDRSIEKVYLYYTESDLSGLAEWSKKKCSVSGSSVSFEVPDGAKNYYISIEDNLALSTSSQIINVE